MTLTQRILLATLAAVGLCGFLTGCWWLGGCRFNGDVGQFMLGVHCALFGPFAFCATMAFTSKELLHDD